ncbi:MAG: hypothetical protein C0510_08485 [Erythrobacter sp.]|nr:hypothetical protein [Erythrobacter sp.]
MTHLRFAGAALAAMSIAATAADQEWKTVTLRDEPGLTISIPVAAVNEADPEDPDSLMFFSVVSRMDGSLTCMAHRADYSQGITRESLAAGIATERREAFCRHDRKTVSDVSIGGSESFERSGSQGAICTASFTDSAEEFPGQVQSQLIIAAPRKAYFLTCIIEDEDQETAEYEWMDFWQDKVRHIQDSFQVPG